MHNFKEELLWKINKNKWKQKNEPISTFLRLNITKNRPANCKKQKDRAIFNLLIKLKEKRA